MFLLAFLSSLISQPICDWYKVKSVKKLSFDSPQLIDLATTYSFL